MNLVIGSELINDDGHTVCVENILRESNHDGVEVFNFKVKIIIHIMLEKAVF